MANNPVWSTSFKRANDKSHTWKDTEETVYCEKCKAVAYTPAAKKECMKPAEQDKEEKK